MLRCVTISQLVQLVSMDLFSFCSFFFVVAESALVCRVTISQSGQLVSFSSSIFALSIRALHCIPLFFAENAALRCVTISQSGQLVSMVAAAAMVEIQTAAVTSQK